MSYTNVEVDYAIQELVTFKGKKEWATRLRDHGALDLYPTVDAALWQIGAEGLKNARVVRRTRTTVTSDWEQAEDL